MDFKFEQLPLIGAYIIETFHAGDARGGFTKNFEKSIYAEHGIDFKCDETFFSTSAKNVVRGLHFQLHNPQAKLVSVTCGKVWDVTVDLRPNSVTFKQWQSVELSAENHRSLYVPRGFAHGFASLVDGSVMLYQCDGAYDEATDTGVRFNDSALKIKWPVDESVAVYSARDLQLPSFEEYLRHPMELE